MMGQEVAERVLRRVAGQTFEAFVDVDQRHILKARVCDCDSLCGDVQGPVFEIEQGIGRGLVWFLGRQLVTSISSRVHPPKIPDMMKSELESKGRTTLAALPLCPRSGRTANLFSAAA